MSPSTRYIENTNQSSPTPDHHTELLDSLTRINLYNPPVQTCSTGWSFVGLYSGPTSIAYLFYRLSSIYPDLVFKGQSLLDWARAYLSLSTFAPKPAVTPGHCGIANETLAHLTLEAVIERDGSLVQRICSYCTVVTSNDEAGSDEWLYGRAGYLYFLRLARSVLDPNDRAAVMVENTIQKIVTRILASPRPWVWYGKEYLGAAHGTIGILTQIVLSQPSAVFQAEKALTEVLATQYSSGNFPSSLPAGSDRLVQFCHGGPGFVLALESLKSQFPKYQADIEKAITAARADIWERGLLTKTPSLCHGITGNALALGDTSQFQHFLAQITTAALEASNHLTTAGHSDIFPSLFEGEAGRAWVWAVADKKLPQTCIGFNDV